MNGSELRAQFLEDAAPIVKNITDTAQGIKSSWEFDINNPDFQPLNHHKTWELAQEIIKSSTDLLKIEAKSTEGIINAVCKGQINVNEAKELIGLLQTKQNMEELPNLLSKLEEMENG